MVPKEPTKEMINAGWLYYMGTKNPSSKGTYKAVLAAATQEVKPQNANTPFVINKSQVCIYANDNQKEARLY
ncbi:hypothetical protein [Klebsiella quasipneumoniae]|uniref:hypothetical protein n=1 Tax=Klebsiella quasipneumoniae TaxID=1463165 RepID=UPI0010EA1E25|nr:hypothetical protein [Klebsiella quasipneumoniae]UDC53387.1 hypothetical protein LGM24_17870 [Klebsiella quasipneumoniae subsp. quasipneumoniae]VGP60021.1 hypothetical protein SB02110_05294 [Klebsiella quasipneumoniae subsp. quasipneumoniae]